MRSQLELIPLGSPGPGASLGILVQHSQADRIPGMSGAAGIVGTGALQEPWEGAEILENIQQEPGSGHTAGPGAFHGASLIAKSP